jgi:hypothetical protein
LVQREQSLNHREHSIKQIESKQKLNNSIPMPPVFDTQSNYDEKFENESDDQIDEDLDDEIDQELNNLEASLVSVSKEKSKSRHSKSKSKTKPKSKSRR